MGALRVSHYKCSTSSALSQDYHSVKPKCKPDIVLVSAGIGSAKILFELQHINCPIIDIGSYVHVLSGKLSIVHGGFFKAPNINN